MRKAGTLVGLTLIALGASARAQDAAPPTAASPAAATEVPPPGETAPPVIPAENAVVAPAPAPAPELAAPAPSDAPRPRRIEIGLSLLPMGLGKFTASPGGMTSTSDAAFTYGFGLQAGYVVLPGLTLGVAPQAFANVKPKEQPSDAAREVDLMVRAAYTIRLVDTIAVYGEALPGYSLILPSSGDVAKGFVLGLGAGVAMDFSDRLFASLGAGYQTGFQKLPARDMSADARTRYVRIAFGIGFRL